MATSLTVVQTLNSFLPQIDRKLKEYTPTQVTGTVTDAMQPSSSLTKEDLQVYNDEVDKSLKFDCVKKLHKQNCNLARPSEEVTSEQDIVSISSTHVIQVLTHVLEAMFPNQWSVKDENPIPVAAQPGVIPKATTIRSDMIWKKIHKEGNEDEVIAILEYKRLPQLRYADYEGIISPRSPGTTATALSTNGIAFSKQVAAYAEQNECQYVAVFDWDHLLLFNFHEMEDNKGTRNTVGKSTKLTWVQEIGDSEGSIEKAGIRKALLGFILVAFKDAGLVPKK